MKIADARILANNYLDKIFTVGGQKVCARELGFNFGWMNSKRTLGQCHHGKKLVRLSEYYVFHNDESLVLDTILHELAHVFNWHVYRGRGHDRSWKRTCVEIGAIPQRCKSEKNDGLVVGDAKYVLRHVETKEVFSKFHKWPSKTYKNIKDVYIRNRKKETLGKLELVGISEAI